MYRSVIMGMAFTVLLIGGTSFAADPVVGSVVTQVNVTGQITTVSVTFTFSDAEGDACYVHLFGHDADTRTYHPMQTFAEGDIHGRTFTPGTHTVTWRASYDREGVALDAANFQVYCRVSDTGRIAPGRFLVIDVSGGVGASSYPVEYKPFVDVTLDAYKTDKIVLRELPDGSWSGVYEVTQRQYELVTGWTPSYFSGNPMRPVEMVSWDDITGTGTYGSGFIKALRDKAGLSALNLPDQTQWEYACRAGTTFDFNDYTQNRGKGAAWGGGLTDATLDRLGWYGGNSLSGTRDVGGKQANAWGLCDLHGNVWEWTTTLYSSDRVVRGGSWTTSADGCRSGDWFYPNPNFRINRLGFRLALPPGQ